MKLLSPGVIAGLLLSELVLSSGFAGLDKSEQEYLDTGSAYHQVSDRVRDLTAFL